MELEKILKGFIKVGKIKDWKLWIDRLPKQKGVYAITRENKESPHFISVGTGAFYKNVDPNVPIEKLLEKWDCSSHQIMYVGRANYDDGNIKYKDCKVAIQKRVREYMRFGYSKKSPHRGGKYIWQMDDSGELDVWYKVCAFPQTIEGELIEKYKPFANLKVGDKVKKENEFTYKNRVEEYLKKDIKDITLDEILELPDDIFYSIELNWLCQWAKGQTRPDYFRIFDKVFIRAEGTKEYSDVVDFFIDKGIVSASKIQSYYYCGYPRAVKIIQDLKSAGYVKDNNNPDIKYRWVLVKKDKEAITRIINEGLNR